MQHRANCQKPSGGRSTTLEHSTESNLAGVTEVSLECSHFSAGQILLMLMTSQLRPKNETGLYGNVVLKAYRTSV